MLKAILIGNLGADAEVKNENGSQFVAFKVADSRRWKDTAGAGHDETTWVSCTMNGDGGKVLPYLTKGTKVLVVGRQSFNVYSSKVDRCMKAGVKMFVESIELVGQSQDSFPKQVVDENGLLIDVRKAYFIPYDIQKEAKYTTLYGIHGGSFSVDPNGFLTPIQEPQQEEPQSEQQS